MNRDDVVAKITTYEDNFTGVDLAGVDLSGLEMPWVNLAYARLRGARFTDSDLSKACLLQVNADCADFSHANLTETNIIGSSSCVDATFASADLTDTTLTFSDFTRASFRGATLHNTHLEESHLEGADFTDADITCAYFTGSGITLDQLRSANTDRIKADLLRYVEQLEEEVPSLLEYIYAGQIDGTTYSTPCGCLAGTCEMLVLENEDRLEDDTLYSDIYQQRNPSSPREIWFWHIRPGDTPEDNPFAQMAVEWLVAWLDERRDTRAKEFAASQI